MKIIIDRFRNFLRNWLFREELQKIVEIRNELPSLINKTKQIAEYQSSLVENRDLLRSAHEMVSQCLECGVDVNMRGGSWAVICLRDKAETIKFIDLGDANGQVIAEYLRHFERRNAIVDADPFIRHLIYREMDRKL